MRTGDDGGAVDDDELLVEYARGGGAADVHAAVAEHFLGDVSSALHLDGLSRFVEADLVVEDDLDLHSALGGGDEFVEDGEGGAFFGGVRVEAAHVHADGDGFLRVAEFVEDGREVVLAVDVDDAALEGGRRG